MRTPTILRGAGGALVTLLILSSCGGGAGTERSSSSPVAVIPSAAGSTVTETTASASAAPDKAAASTVPGTAASTSAAPGLATEGSPVHSGEPPAGDANTVPMMGMGSCVETYTAETLQNRAFAFDGTITAIEERTDPAVDDGQAADTPTLPWVTFAVNQWYTGGTAQTVGVWLPQLSGSSGAGTVLSTGGLSGEVGTRLLVAGEEIGVGTDPAQLTAWSCGFSQPYTPEAAAAWERSLSQ